MPAPDAARLCAVLETTWPPAARHDHGPWVIRDGQGGGKRVSAATARTPVSAGDIALAEAAMRTLGQPPLFMIREGEEALDAALADRDYRIVDPVVIYVAPIAALAVVPLPISALPCWPPLAIQRDLWAEAGIGPGRIAVMDRVTGAKAAILGRVNDRAAGTAFVALDGDVAMIHALEVTPAQRRQGAAHNMLRGAAIWAQDSGAAWMSLVVTRANQGARALYASLGMDLVGHYHYRVK